MRFKNKKNKGNLVAAMIVFAAGVLVIAAMTATKIRWDHFSENGVRVNAEVTRVSTFTDSDGDPEYTIYIEYDYNGETYNGKLDDRRTSRKKGEIISILIDPADPRATMSDPGDSLWLLIIPGGLMMAVGIFIFVRYMRS